MTDLPILFSAPMIRALLDGRKTQTRRVIKPRGRAPSLFDGSWSDSYILDPGNASWRERDVPVKALDRLWVREVCRGEELSSGQDGVRYKSDDYFAPIASTFDAAHSWLALHTYAGHSGHPVGKWVPSIHMPRWASRITLIVTDVRVERLQDISEADARAEGFPITWDGKPYDPPPPEVDTWQGYGRASFCLFWSKLNGPGTWDANPWVAAYTFTVHHQNIDQIERAAA